jgi:A118 family predicted phage portal protein
MFHKLIDWLRQVAAKMFGIDKITKYFPGVAVTDIMVQAIERWMKMYINCSPWLAHDKKSLKLPSAIAAEISTLVTLEMQVKVFGSARAEYLNTMLDPFRESVQKNTEYACAQGGIVFKPYVDGTEIAIDYVQADDFYPTAFNSRGEITGALFLERMVVGNTYYTRIEQHSFTNDRKYVISNKAFKSMMKDSIGEEIALANIAEWASIQPEVSIDNLDAPLFAYFKIPLGNTIDTKSPLGVSVYARAEDLIKEADLQFQRLCWEYEGGELAIDASEDVFSLDKRGKPVLPVGKERLFRPNKLDPKNATAETLMKTFSPALRDSNYLKGLNNLLMRIEDLCGLARGTYSDPNVEAMTATQLKMSKQRTYATVTSIQMALQKAINALVKAMDILATLYKLSSAGTYTTEYKWDDSIVTDTEVERMRDMQEVAQGVMLPWEFRVKWYGEDEAKAKRRLSEGSGMTDDELMGFDKKKDKEEDVGSEKEEE